MKYLTYQYRLYPNANQEVALKQQLETLRQVYNTALGYWRDFYDLNQRAPKPNEIYRVFSVLRNLQIVDQRDGGSGPHWLTHISAAAMRDVIGRLKTAFNYFFQRIKAGVEKPSRPRFKSRGSLRSIPCDSYSKSQGGCKLQNRNGAGVYQDVPPSRAGYRLYIFGVGRVKALIHRRISGVIKTLCVKRDVDGKWYLFAVAESEPNHRHTKLSTAVGIDLGIKKFLVTSSGDTVENPRILESRLPELRRLQRSVSRKRTAAVKSRRKFYLCMNLQKSSALVSKFHVRVRNLRKEHRHQIAGALVRRYGFICAENLNVPSMIKDSDYSRAVGDVGWAGFLTVLQHKAEKAGVQFMKVNPAYTSQTCSLCGHCEESNRVSQERFCCLKCSHTENADVNAAKNILARGIANVTGSVAVQRNLCNSGDAERSSHEADGSQDRSQV